MHELFEKRRSIRKYQEALITDEQLHSILSAGMVAPSGCNTKGYELIVVKNKEILRQLSQIGKWIDFIAKCSVAIIVIAKEYTFWIEDCSLVNGWMMLEAENQGFSSCWADIKDGIELDNTDREPIVRKILSIPNEYRVLNMLAIGKSNQNIKLHTEDEYKSKKVHFEKY